MKPKVKVKLFIDILMTISLVLLMAYQVVGETLHEWLGAAMLLLFILHNVLNIKWYSRLFKGKYNGLRIVGTVVNFAILIAMLCLGASGIIMSRHLFAFLPISAGMAGARLLHMAASYWGFVLMSLHLGLHMTTVMAVAKKSMGLKSLPKIPSGLLRAAIALGAAFGLYRFFAENFLSYMLVRTQFVFLDYEAHPALVFVRYIAIMIFFAAAAYYGTRLSALIKGRKKEEEK